MSDQQKIRLSRFLSRERLGGKHKPFVVLELGINEFNRHMFDPVKSQLEFYDNVRCFNLNGREEGKELTLKDTTDDTFYVHDNVQNFVKLLKKYRGDDPPNFPKSNKHDEILEPKDSIDEISAKVDKMREDQGEAPWPKLDPGLLDPKTNNPVLQPISDPLDNLDQVSQNQIDQAAVDHIDRHGRNEDLLKEDEEAVLDHLRDDSDPEAFEEFLNKRYEKNKFKYVQDEQRKKYSTGKFKDDPTHSRDYFKDEHTNDKENIQELTHEQKEYLPQAEKAIKMAEEISKKTIENPNQETEEMFRQMGVDYETGKKMKVDKKLGDIMNKHVEEIVWNCYTNEEKKVLTKEEIHYLQELKKEDRFAEANGLYKEINLNEEDEENGKNKKGK